MIAVAILAAGKGTRMKSDLPKVCHTLGSVSMVERVVQSCLALQPVRCLVIVGYQAEYVKQSLNGFTGIEFVEQKEQLGTGHAVQQLLPYLDGFTGDLLVLNGDAPLLRINTIQQLVSTHKTNNNAATMLTAEMSNPFGYGRVFFHENNLVKEIIEERDCTLKQKENRRINAGIYCFNWSKLAQILPKLQSNNDQKEYYLTDVVSHLEPVMAVDVADYQEILGINDRKQLATAYEILQTRVKDDWMKGGVTIIDPNSITIDDTVQLQPDVVIEPQSHLRGNTIIGAGSKIGPGSLIENSTLGKNVRVLYSVVSDAVVKDGTQIGPYTHLRGNVEVGESCRVGNFVELKNAQIGNKTNIAHLSYIGDAKLGNKVNIGAGTITANYDGVNKHKTEIRDRTKVGSNSVLVAPVTLGEDVTVAAGSVVTENVADDALVIARSRQVVKPGWRLKSQGDKSGS